jgi:CO/xanthine dehydrogenase Mo-binding subunit
MADIAGANGKRPDFKVVGKPNLPGKLSYSLATGKAKFGVDYVFDNMLHAKFPRSPHANATVTSVDVAAAKKIPGVVDILTWEDEDLKNFGRRSGGMGGGAPKQQTGGAPLCPPDLQLQVQETIHHQLPAQLRQRARAAEWANLKAATSTR